MDEQTVIQLLEQLHEFEVQRDGIEEEKRRLLDQIQIPEEAKRIHDEGMLAIRDMENAEMILRNLEIGEIRKQIDEVVVPEEVRAVLEEIEKKRAELREAERSINDRYNEKIAEARQQKLEELDAEVKSVYDSVAQRKLDIADEFAGKKGVAEQNIADLIKKIEDAVKELKTSIKGTHKMAVYTPGKTSWNTKALDNLIIEGHDELKPFRKVGDPYIQIRKI